jgi:Xaa-Pro aminopeptidase
MQATKEKLDVPAIQKALSDEGVDAWVFYFFHGNDPLATHILGLPESHFVSRRWFYVIPAKGEPQKLVHRIEMDALDTVPGKQTVYLGWRELEQKLKEMLSPYKKVAMQYSANNAIPYISRVDAGTLELIRSFGCEVVTSADLVQMFEARWTQAQLKSHTTAVENLRSIVFDAFEKIRRHIAAGERVTEYDIQQFISRRFDELGMVSNSPCIVAVNEHSGSPHYQPTATQFSEIKQGDFVLLDIWAKLKEPADAVYADITWTGFVGETVPQKYTDIFNVVAGARDAAVNFLKAELAAGKVVHGWQVDDVTRKHITEKGYGEYFVHRTGHSIGLEVHANGANIDNLETRDERRLIPNTCFSIEPGVYLAEFGVRSEIDVYIGNNEVIVGGQPIQTEVIPIMVAK